LALPCVPLLSQVVSLPGANVVWRWSGNQTEGAYESERTVRKLELRTQGSPEHEDYTLYSSHSIWQGEATFEAWSKSEHSVLPIGTLARTSRSTSTIRSSKPSRSARRYGAARMRSRRARRRGNSRPLVVLRVRGRCAGFRTVAS